MDKSIDRDELGAILSDLSDFEREGRLSDRLRKRIWETLVREPLFENLSDFIVYFAQFIRRAKEADGSLFPLIEDTKMVGVTGPMNISFPTGTVLRHKRKASAFEFNKLELLMNIVTHLLILVENLLQRKPQTLEKKLENELSKLMNQLLSSFGQRTTSQGPVPKSFRSGSQAKWGWRRRHK